MKNILKFLFPLILIPVFTSCTQTMYLNNKQFVVKGINCEKTCEYTLYNSKNKKKIIKFNDAPNKYQIGDTLIITKFYQQ